MTKEEFLDYLYNNSENLNSLFILEYLFDKFSYPTIDESTYLDTPGICKYFSLTNFKFSSSVKGYESVIGYLYYHEDIKTIEVSNNLSDIELRNVTLFLLFEYFKNYKLIKDGYQFIITANMDEKNNLFAEVLLKEKAKIIEFPKKY